jgi:spoIIIJ-associated protein
MSYIETTGKSVEQAVEAAAAELGVSVDEVRYEVLEESSKGLFGLGHGEVRIKASAAESSGKETGNGQYILGLLTRILEAMGFDARPVLVAESDDEISINIEGASEDLGRLIGRHGQTIDALQYLMAVAINRVDPRRIRIILDAEGYRDRHQKSLEVKARELADLVKAHGEEAVLDPQNPRDRRIIHMTLADDPGVVTYSEGEGDDRHVVISPRK